MRRLLKRRGGSVAATRLHALAFVGGLSALALGLAGWAFEGGPTSIEDVVVVIDLTVGGTLLATGALVGRARGAELRWAGQLQVLQFAARRMSASLTFEEPDLDRFPSLNLARRAGEVGGTLPAVLNAANEVAVAAFLDGRIRFPEIADTVAEVLDNVDGAAARDLDDLVAADAEARCAAERRLVPA